MAKFRKKPVVIEAFKFTWNVAIGKEPAPEWFIRAMKNNIASVGFTHKITNSHWGEIKTLEGVMNVSPGDWIIKEPFPTDDRNIYPCKPDIFGMTYDKLD